MLIIDVSYDIESYDSQLNGDKITTYIHHPIVLDPVAEKPPPPPTPAPLTKEERKKQKRMAKQEKQKDEQDMIRYGLKPPPEARCMFLALSFFIVVNDVPF